MSLTDLDLPTLQQRAKAGDAAAEHELGLRLLKAARLPRDQQAACAWIERAAAQGNGAALHVCAVLSAAGFLRAVDWGEAMRLTTRAAAAGDALAREELDLLGPVEGFDLERFMDRAASTQVRIRPRIETFQGFIPRSWCDWIIRRSRPALEATKIYGAAGFENDQARTNTGAGFAVGQSDLVFQLTDARIARALDAPASHQEPTNVLHYEPGQQFKLHHDYLDPRAEPAARDIQANGQRVATFLIYLNDGYEGGETDFPSIGWRFKGKAGDAIAFWNVTADGRPDSLTVHAGLPPGSGEKWLLSKWVRDRPFALR